VRRTSEIKTRIAGVRKKPWDILLAP